MKNAKSGQANTGRSAEDWVKLAKKFGDDCQAVQNNAKLSIDQKIEKQGDLAKQMAKEIEADAHLKSEEKKAMIASIGNYMKDWTKIFDMMKSTMEAQKNTAKK